MIKLLYRSVNLIASMLGGLLAGLIFKGAWKIIGRGDEAPKPTDEQQGWGEILLAATLQGAIFAVVKAAFDRGAAEVTRKLTGISPGEEGSSPTSLIPGSNLRRPTSRLGLTRSRSG